MKLYNFYCKNKKKTLLIITVLGIMPLFICASQAFALTDDEIETLIMSNKSYFTTNNIILDAIRWIGWGIVTFLSWLCDGIQDLYKITLGLMDFTTYAPYEGWIQTFKAVCTAIMALSILIYGIILMVDHEKKPKIFKSICLAGLSISAVSYLLITANGACAALATEIAGESVSSSVVNENLYDLLYIDKIKGISTLDKSDATYLTECRYSSLVLDNISINEVVNYDSPLLTTDDAKGKSGVFGKYVVLAPTAEGGVEPSLKGIYNGFGWNDGDDNDFFNTFYYRYKVNYFPIYITLIAIIIVYICMSYKVVRIIFEIATERFLVMLYAQDLNGTQKTLKIFAAIKDGYIVLMLTAVLTKVFRFAQTFLSEKFASNPFVYSLCLLFVAFAVIDGPNLIQQLTGIDAGLSSGTGKLIAAMHMARGAKDSIRTSAQTIGNMANIHRQNKQHSELLNSMQSKNSGGDMNAMNQSVSSNSQLKSSNSNQSNNIDAAANSNLNNNKDADSGMNNISSEGSNINNQSEQNVAANENSNNEANIESANNAENMESNNNAANIESGNSYNEKENEQSGEQLKEAEINMSDSPLDASSPLTNSDNTFSKMNDELGKMNDSGNGNLNMNGMSGLDMNSNISNTYEGNLLNGLNSSNIDIPDTQKNVNVENYGFGKNTINIPKDVPNDKLNLS